MNNTTITLSIVAAFFVGFSSLYLSSFGEKFVTENARNESIVDPLFFDRLSRSFHKSRQNIQKYFRETLGFNFGLEIDALTIQKYYDEDVELLQMQYQQAELEFDEMYYQLMKKKYEKDKILKILKKRINENAIVGIQKDITMEKEERMAKRNELKDELKKLKKDKKGKLKEMKQQKKERNDLVKEFKNKLKEYDRKGNDLKDLELEKYKLELEYKDFEKQWKEDKKNEKLEKKMNRKKEDVEKKTTKYNEKKKEFEKLKDELNEIVKKICDEDKSMIIMFEDVVNKMIDQDKKIEKIGEKNKVLAEKMKKMKKINKENEEEMKKRRTENEYLRGELNKAPKVEHYHIHGDDKSNNNNNNNDNEEDNLDFVMEVLNWAGNLFNSEANKKQTTQPALA